MLQINIIRNLLFLKRIFSYRFSSYEQIIKNTIERYSYKKEVSHYNKIVKSGLNLLEKEAFFKAKGYLLPSLTKVLVIGCGAGREALEIADSELEVTAIDNSVEMINEAQTNYNFKNIKWLTTDQFKSLKNKEFDIIYCNAYLSSNIPSQDKRKEFFKDYIDMLSSEGIFVYFPDIFDTDKSLRFKVISYLLKFRFLLVKDIEWEKGDVIRNYLGDHFEEIHPIYYHYYKNLNNFKRTLPKEHRIVFSTEDYLLISK